MLHWNIGKLRRWIEGGEQLALVTVLRATGSVPCPLGVCMVVSRSGGVWGSISGGCIDGDVVTQAQEVLASGQPRRLCYSAPDDEVVSIGLACGGSLELYIEPLAAVHRSVLDVLEKGEACGLATRLAGGHLVATSRGPIVGDSALFAGLAPLFPGPAAFLHEFDGAEVFFQVFPAPPTLTIIGAVEIAVFLTQLAQTLGFRVRIVDPRRYFLTEERFPTADELVSAWPGEVLQPEDLGPQDYVVILAHDSKLDLPALQIALRSRAAYVGLIGARATQAERRRALASLGFGAEELKRVHGPVGLDLGGREPAEIALAILAEIIAVRHNRSGGMLSACSSHEGIEPTAC